MSSSQGQSTPPQRARRRQERGETRAVLGAISKCFHSPVLSLRHPAGKEEEWGSGVK